MIPQLVTLQNKHTQVSLFPDIGAKLFDLVHRPSGHNFLWHNPRILPQPYPIDANFDNYWCGGWDDGFPTCDPCSYKGEQYPNLGELRSLRWEVCSLDEQAAGPSISLAAHGPISSVRAEKIVRLSDESVDVRFQIDNIGNLPVDFIWGSHPAFAIEPGCILHIPARSGIVAQSNHPRLGVPGQKYNWPILESGSEAVNMTLVPPPGVMAGGHYAVDLTAGWYALEFPARKLGVFVEFPLDICPYLWLWLSYGGWRGYYVAVVEPWTSCPVTLSEAVQANTHRTLSPGDTFSCQIRATPWSHPSTLNDVLMRRRSNLEQS